MNFEQFAKKHQIAVRSARIAKNPNMKDSDKMDNWECTLYCGNEIYTFYYSKGIGHKGEAPTVEEVLCCLSMDVSYIECGYDCEDFIEEFGYDCCEGKKVYNATLKEHGNMIRLLGEKFEEFIKCEED